MESGRLSCHAGRSVAAKVRELTRIGAELEVLSPPDLRDGLADVARRMVALYVAEADIKAGAATTAAAAKASRAQ